MYLFDGGCDNRGSLAIMRAGLMQGNSVLSFQFCCGPKTAPKKLLKITIKNFFKRAGGGVEEMSALVYFLTKFTCESSFKPVVYTDELILCL